MNDYRSNDDSKAVKTVIGFALGAIVGAGLALLLAPASGVETRQRLGETARRLGKDAKSRLDEARDKVTDLGSSARSAVQAGREAFLQDGTRETSRLGARGSSVTTPSTTSMP